MATVKRGNSWHLRIRPFDGDGPVFGVSTPAKNRREANRIEMAILSACRSKDYRGLDPVAREVCTRLFRNKQWEIPATLSGEFAENCPPPEELTLWKAARLFFRYPEIQSSKSRWRYECALLNLVKKLGKDRPLKSIWIPHLKQYQIERMNDGAAADTINWELSTLSRIFGVMIELQLVETNPVRQVKRLSTKKGERQVYLSFQDVQAFANACPRWFQPIILTSYYTGLRRGVILSLTRKQVNFAKRIVTLYPADTKEAHWKRVPIHQDLMPVLHEASKVSCLGTEDLFLLYDGRVPRKIGIETFKNPWLRAREALRLTEPWPRFHDLRHTWKTNARRSGMDPEIRESILGHWYKAKSVNERYGRIGDEELVAAIDGMSFDHGKTEILVARSER